MKKLDSPCEAPRHGKRVTHSIRKVLCSIVFFSSAVHGAAIPAATSDEPVFRKVASIGDRIPGTSTAIENVHDVSTSKGNVVFVGIGRNAHYGVYGFFGNQLTKIAETGDRTPRGGKFTIFSFPAISGDSVVFRGISRTEDGVSHDGIYLWESGEIAVIADDSMSVPNSDENFGVFFKGAITDGDVVFRAAGGRSSGIYKYSKGSTQRIADDSVPIPKSGEVFAGVMEPTISKGIVAFKGYQHTIDGIFLHDGNRVEVAADTRSKVPGRDDQFKEFTIPSNDGNTVAFWSRYGDRRNGIYKLEDGILSVVADVTTMVPGRHARFQIFQSSPSISGTRVAFMALDSENVIGIYLHDGKELHKVVDSNSLISGKRLTDRKPFENLRARSYDEGHIVFIAKFSEGTEAIYLADAPW